MRVIFIFFWLLLVVSCKAFQRGNYPGEEHIPLVPTVTKPVQKQWKGVWTLDRGTVMFSNDFEGGRLNGVSYDGDNHFTLLITAENIPINPSPWYAFKVWSTVPREIIIQLTYQDSRSRYYPKISTDGIHFQPLDSNRVESINPGTELYGIQSVPESVSITLAVGEHPVWITAQELYTSSRVKEWMDSLSTHDFVFQEKIGKSKEGRPIHLMSIGDMSSTKALMVISRQHPPEVTGYLAMKSFIETLCGDSEEIQKFRSHYVTYCVPLMNPDGVDLGYWRHSAGGVDLNRDWHVFNQPETRVVRDFLEVKNESGIDFIFGVDFHSTWDDIYYPLDSTIANKENALVYRWIERISNELPHIETKVVPSKELYPTMISRNHFYLAYDMPAIIFELGDNTPREFLKVKGQVAAQELVRLLDSYSSQRANE